MPNELRWLKADEVVRINRRVVATTGEPFQLRDRSLLDSGCDRAANLFHDGDEGDLLVLAVALIAGIGRNHPFAQGNKRTALAAGLVFLQGNGWELDMPDMVNVANAVIALIEHRIEEAELVEYLAPWVVERKL